MLKVIFINKINVVQEKEFLKTFKILKHTLTFFTIIVKYDQVH